MLLLLLLLLLLEKQQKLLLLLLILIVTHALKNLLIFSAPGVAADAATEQLSGQG